MPTTEELYATLIAPGKPEKDAKAEHARKQAQETRMKNLRKAKPEHPTCAEVGHTLKGEWTIQTTPTGKQMGLCGRCGTGQPLEKFSTCGS